MAIPAFRAVGATANGTVAITPASPAGVLAGDVLLCFLETNGQAITLSGGTETWAEVTGSPQNLATNPTRLTVFWARASQNTPTMPTTSSSGDHQIGYIMAFSGCIATGNPWDVTSGNVKDTLDTAVSITGATTTVADCLVVAISTRNNDVAGAAFSAWANTDLVNLTERGDGGGVAGTGGGIGVACGEKAAAGAYGATTATTAANATNACMSIALKPPVVVTGAASLAGTLLASATATLTIVASATLRAVGRVSAVGVGVAPPEPEPVLGGSYLPPAIPRFLPAGAASLQGVGRLVASGRAVPGPEAIRRAREEEELLLLLP
jgi:hypothetical protein